MVNVNLFKSKKKVLYISFIAIIIFSSFPMFSSSYLEYDSALLPYYTTKNFQNTYVDSTDLSLFFNGLNAGYFVSLFYSFLSMFFSFPIISKFLPPIIMWFTFIFSYKVFDLVNLRHKEIFSFIFAMYSSSFHFFQGANIRSYGFLLVFLFLFFLLKKEYIFSSIVVIASLFVYPTFFPIFLLSLAGILLLSKRNKFHSIILIVFLSLFFFVLYGFGVNSFSDASSFSYAEMKSMVDFHEGGEFKFFLDSFNYLSDFLFFGKGSLDFYSWPMHFESQISLIFSLFFVLLSVLFFFNKSFRLVFKRDYKKEINKELILLSLVSIFFFFLAHISLRFFGLGLLYFPVSYTKHIIPIALAIFAFKFIDKNKILVFSLLFLISFVFLVGFDFDFVKVPLDKNCYEFIESLPANSVIAGHPLSVSYITTITNHIVFSSERFLILPGKDFYESERGKIKEAALVHYSSWEDVCSFCEINDVDYFLFDRTVGSEGLNYLRSRGIIDFNDYNSNISDVAIPLVPNERIVYNSSNFLIAKCS